MATATFGKTSESGETNAETEDCITGGVYTPTSSGLGVSITAYIKVDGAHNMKCALYNNATNALIENGTTSERSVNTSNVYAWETFTFPTNPSIVAGTAYLICVWSEDADGNARVQADEGSGTARQDTTPTYNGFPDPFTQDFSAEAEVNIYCTYEITDNEYTNFNTIVGSATSFIWNSGQFNYNSGMCASSSTPTKWRWYVVSSSSDYFYPSGDATRWIWVSGSYNT